MLDGVVAVSHDEDTFTMGQHGDMLQEGDVIRTGAGAHEVLTIPNSVLGRLGELRETSP